MKSSYKWYRTRASNLSADQIKILESHLQQLDNALLQKDVLTADREARELEIFCKQHFKKTFSEYLIEIAIAVVIALLVATVIRQTWFEFYEIPSGSMRPTFKEEDHLTVTKTTFGINVPLQTAHFYFDPKLVQRTSVFIWSGDGVPHLDSDSTFMGIFPYTKRYIKRCMGKPGDTLYFYGGKLYGFDRDGNEIQEFLNSPWLEKIDHVPFLSFEGRRSYVQDQRTKMVNEWVFNHIDEPQGRYTAGDRAFKGEIFNGREWIKDDPLAQRKPHKTLQTFSDFFGMRNYAIGRILTKKQVETLTPFSLKDFEEAPLYMELRHTPSLTYPTAVFFEHYIALIRGYGTLIPLQDQHIKVLMENMYTCRFSVQDGRGYAYSAGSRRSNSSSSPLFPNVPDGSYEFYYGKGVKVGFAAITSPLPADHPLYSLKPTNVQKLFNVGMEMVSLYEPSSRNPGIFPDRYAYFRDGDLYVMGAPLMKKDDPILKAFHKREKKRETASTEAEPYVAFKDYGPPVTSDGKLDKEFIKIFGYKVPEGKYLALGDNHAMSQDSRYFGPIPQANLQGTPSLILWPPGDRWGMPNQKPYPVLTTPRLIVWSIVVLICLVWFLVHRYRIARPIFKKIQ